MIGEYTRKTSRNDDLFNVCPADTECTSVSTSAVNLRAWRHFADYLTTTRDLHYQNRQMAFSR